MNALEAGDLAGRVGAEALRGEPLNADRLARYEREWNRTVGSNNDRYLRLADLLYRTYGDEDLEKIWSGMEAFFRRREQGGGIPAAVVAALSFPPDFVRAAVPVLLAFQNRRILF
jgi:flavin-dependent dehydrogenase